MCELQSARHGGSPCPKLIDFRWCGSARNACKAGYFRSMVNFRWQNVNCWWSMVNGQQSIVDGKWHQLRWHLSLHTSFFQLLEQEDHKLNHKTWKVSTINVISHHISFLETICNFQNIWFRLFLSKCFFPDGDQPAELQDTLHNQHGKRQRWKHA